MTLPPIELQRGDCAEIEAFLSERIYEFNAKATGYTDGESFAAVQRNETGAIVAGISGYTWGGVCFVSNLWVDEAQRGRDLGATLLRLAEQNARDKGCIIAHLSTHGFQAPGFYERMGYEAGAIVNDHPVGHTNVFYAKRLTAGGA